MPSNAVKKSSRNGKVELLRFVFCICVLMFHIQKYLVGEPKLDRIDLAVFPHGAMGVEFFFLLSGFFMAKSIDKKRKADPENANKFTGSEGIAFIKHKYMSIFPQHIVAFAITFIIYAITKEFSLFESVSKLVDSLPSMFLVQMTGINYTSPNHIEWYISCMLVALAVLYPLCKKYYDVFTKYIAPIGALLLFGYMIYTTKSLTGVMKWNGICYKSMLRAFGEVALGTTAYEFSKWLSTRELSKKGKLFLTLCELGCFAGSMMYVMMTFTKKYEIYVLVLLFFMVSIIFSGKTYGSDIFNNKFCLFLGKFSLPVYLGQLAAIYIGTSYLTEYNVAVAFSMIVAMTFVFALVIMLLGDFLNKKFFSKI